MSAYLIADIKVTDDSWVPEYATGVLPLVEKHGGRYLSRSGNVVTLEGEPRDTTLIAIIEFPSTGAIDAFLADPEYAPYAEARRAGSISHFVRIDDTDVAGAIAHLPAG